MQTEPNSQRRATLSLYGCRHLVVQTTVIFLDQSLGCASKGVSAAPATPCATNGNCARGSFRSCVLFAHKRTNEHEGSIFFGIYMTERESVLFKPARSASIRSRCRPSQRDPKWSHKLTVRERLISAARCYRFPRCGASAPVDVDESVSDKMHEGRIDDWSRVVKICRAPAAWPCP